MGAGKGQTRRMRSSTKIEAATIIPVELKDWYQGIPVDETFGSFYELGGSKNFPCNPNTAKKLLSLEQEKILELFITDLVNYGALLLPPDLGEWKQNYKVSLNFNPDLGSDDVYMSLINKNTQTAVPVPDIFGSVFPVSPRDKDVPGLLPDLKIHSLAAENLAMRLTTAMNILFDKEQIMTRNREPRAVDVEQLPKTVF